MKNSGGKSLLEYFGFVTNKTLYKLIRKIMATVDEIKTQLVDIQSVVTNVSGDVDSLLKQVADLKLEVEAGKVATQADLDAISVSAQGIKDSLSSVDVKEPAPV